MIYSARNILLKNSDFLFRVAGLGGKFLLILILARTMTASVVGAFGLVTATISVCLYFVGLDFYVYTTREILSAEQKKSTGNIIYNQVLFFFFTYLILMMLWPYITHYSQISAYATIALALVISEHLSQEIYRFLIALKKNRFANFCLFLRSGAWCYVIIPIIFLKKISLYEIFYTWFAFSLISVLLGLLFLKYSGSLDVLSFKPDFKWITNGVGICALFFIGTISIRAINYFDKIIAVHFLDLNIIGAYVFYAGIGSAIQSVIDVLIMTRYYPDVVKFVQRNDEKNIKKSMKEFQINNWKANIILYSLGSVFCYIVALFTEKEIYTSFFFVFIFIAVANIITNLSMPYHYWIYAKKYDLFLIVTNVLALIAFVLISYGLLTFIPALGVSAILGALILSNLIIIVRKKNHFKKVHGK
ncbi:lipopolysaccharide biosynthesis protein [Enterobacter cloacae]|uniref:lipopolysaccharide biosynthesis protein n=1 Tax=Enterobacter cloacae TaxID=550 RepID=UPI000735B1EC|nr:hypothetical protein [Enterobacter cloacae]KTH74899.1 hypothetical protein ASV19_00690 [Enterobacter cloacae subsp. cloacae]MDE7636328.1 hypothetical protein [Enterobacter cloacae]MDR9912084.1 hypothetical protein [Enterobacter cloacae subsp. cloacae]HAS1234180.1 hypothetical protein [Enterobacter cloacae]HAS1239160.1 hypothetical protein [Enterobacter cloacae]